MDVQELEGQELEEEDHFEAKVMGEKLEKEHFEANVIWSGER